MKVAEAIAAVLKAEGVDTLVCYPRQLLIDACTRAGIRPVVCRQERVGAGMADGISRSTNGAKIGVFAMQGGPGVENAFAGVAQVYADNVPVLFLPAGPLGRRNTPPHFYAIEHFAKVTKWAAELDKPARTAEIMRRAFQQLRSGRPGPVMIELPNDVIEADIGGALDYTPVKRVRSAPDPADVRTVAELLLKSTCPVIHAGQGTMYAGATEELVKLAELIQAPVMTTNTGKSAFPEDHPLSIGACVISAPKAVFHFLRKADLVLGVGASFTVNPWTPKIPPGKRVVQITNDPGDINKEVPVVAAILADAKLALQALIAEIGSRRRSDSGLAAEIRAVKQEWREEWRAELASSEKPINQYRILHDLMRAVDTSNTIITHEAGSPREQAVPFWESRAPRGYLGWGKSTQLGHGLGLIMGAKLANPGKLCINLMGDASIGMVGMDLETAVRNRIGILTIVFNNGVMAGEKNAMPLSVEQHRASDVGGNYSEVAKGLGVWSRRIDDADEFTGVLRQALEITQGQAPALIECMAKQNYKFSRY
jgi:acetolactate synthase I/II/III large subunit